MWKILQHKVADDFVIATEKQYSVKFFIDRCFKFLNIRIKWQGKGLKVAKITSFDKNKYPNLKLGQIVIKISKKYFRPNEVENLIGNTSKARNTFGWSPKTSIDNLVKEMLISDLKINNKFLKKKIFISGHNGMVGSAVYKLYKIKKIQNFVKKKLNLLNFKKLDKWFMKTNLIL